MKTEDIIEGLNIYIEYTRAKLGLNPAGHLVLLRVITLNPTFKAYKVYEAILWYIDKKNRIKILTVNDTFKVIEGQEEAAWRLINIKLVTLIFKWMTSDNYKEVLEGRYDTISEYKDE